MAKRRSTEKEPAIRKSFLITGGVAIAVVVLAFIVTTFVFGGGGGEVPDTPEPVAGEVQNGVSPQATPTPAPTEPAGLTPGGRDPFTPVGGAPAAG